MKLIEVKRKIGQHSPGTRDAIAFLFANRRVGLFSAATEGFPVPLSATALHGQTSSAHGQHRVAPHFVNKYFTVEKTRIIQ